MLSHFDKWFFGSDVSCLNCFDVAFISNLDEAFELDEMKLIDDVHTVTSLTAAIAIIYSTSSFFQFDAIDIVRFYSAKHKLDENGLKSF